MLWAEHVSGLMGKLSETLKVTQSVKSVTLERNKLNHVDAMKLCEGLGENKSVTLLNVLNNNFGEQGIQSVAKVVRKSHTLVHLNVGMNQFCGGEGFQTFCDALKDNQSLRHLNLSCNAIFKGSGFLALALSRNVSLRHLDLSECQLRDDALEVLLEALPRNPSLLYLSLRGNQLRDEDAESVGRMLVCSTVLQGLNLSENSIGPLGGVHLARGLDSNSSLLSLDLCANKLGPMGTSPIFTSLQYRNRTLTSLNLRRNDLDDCVAERTSAVANILRHNFVLCRLHLDEPALSSSSVELSEAFQRNGSILEMGTFGVLFCKRNSEAHTRARESVLALLMAARKCKQVFFPKEISKMMGESFWRTRADVDAWNDESTPSANVWNMMDISFLLANEEFSPSSWEPMKNVFQEVVDNVRFNRIRALDLSRLIKCLVTSEDIASLCEALRLCSFSLRELRIPNEMLSYREVKMVQYAIQKNGGILICPGLGSKIKGFCERNALMHQKVREMCEMFLCVWRFRKQSSALMRNVSVYIAKCLWDTRTDLSTWHEE